MKRAKYFITVLSILFLFCLWTQVYAGWSPEKRISEPGVSWYPQIVAQGDTLHVAYTNSAGADKVSYVRSTNGGKTWLEPRILSDTIHSANSFLPRLIIFNSRIIVLWKDIIYQGINRYNIGYSISYNWGISWSGPFYVLDYNIDHIHCFTAAGCDSIINIMYDDANDIPYRIYNIKSPNFGQSWSEPEELITVNELGRMSMEAYGNVFHFIWYGNFNDGDSWETYYMKIIEGSPLPSEYMPLTPEDDRNSYWPSITTNEKGQIAFCWVDFRYSQYFAQGDLFVKYSDDSGENWTDERQIYFNHHAGGLTDIFYEGKTIHIVWEDLRFDQRDIFYFERMQEEPIVYDWCVDYRIESNSANSYSPSITGSNGKLFLVWSDFRNNPDRGIYPGIYFSYYKNTERIIGQERIEAPHVRPNPFNSEVMITFNHVEGGEVCLEIYDITGRLVKKLRQGVSTNGWVNFVWDATDNSGNKVSSGVYFAKVLTSPDIKAVKLLYLK